MKTKKTDITLPPLPGALIDVETEARAYARAAVEADRQGRMPSDEKLPDLFRDALSWGRAWGRTISPLDWGELRDDQVTQLLSRYSSGQPAASAEPTAEIEDLIDRLLDAQQDINLAANENMSQPLCNASTLIDEVETVLRRLAAPVAQEPVSVTERWQGGDDSNMVSRVDTTAPVAAQEQTDHDEDAYVIASMGRLLAEIAVIVRGAEQPLHRHGYADLPARVAALKAESVAAQAQSSGNPGELDAQDREDARQREAQAVSDFMDQYACDDDPGHCALDWCDSDNVDALLDAIDAARAAKGADHG